jgi:hypothetical protein
VLEEKQPELFDLHVMMFADRSTATVVALQQAFAIDREVAERLLAEAPIMVKRGADPEVAAVLLDALQSLGAQVVLLPSAAKVAPVTSKSSGVAPAATPVWGGLDLEPASSPAVGRGLELEQSADGGWRGETARDLDGGLMRGSSLPPPAVPSSIPAAASRRAQPAVGGGLEWESAELELGPPSEPPFSATASPISEHRGDPTKPLAPGPRFAPPVPGADAPMRRVAPPVLADLGLGTVPPLPPAVVAGVAASTPPRSLPAPIMIARAPVLAPIPSVAPPTRSQVQQPQPRIERERARPPAADAPELRLPDLAPPRGAAASQARAQGRTGHGEPDDEVRSPGSDLGVAASKGGPVRSELDGAAGDGASHAAPTQRTPEPAEVRSRARGFALAELIGGVLLLFLGVHMDNSVLYGNATQLSLLLHGFAFYGLGAGIAGLWP